MQDITQNAMVSINTILIQAMRMANYDGYTTIIQLSRCKSTCEGEREYLTPVNTVWKEM